MQQKAETQGITKENKMGVMPVDKLLINMSLPMMISMLVQALYNIVDSIFVARIDENALTAVSLAFPIQTLMVALGAGTGVGINALLSKALGEKDYERVNKIAENGVFLALVNYIVFLLVGLFATGIFYRTQTQDAAIIAYGEQYLSIVCCFSMGVEDLRASYNKNGVINSLAQFVGVSRLDDSGFIQLGYSAERYADALKTASAEVLADDYVFGKNGFVIISENGKIISSGRKDLKGKSWADSGWASIENIPENELFSENVNETPVFMMTRRIDSYRLTIVMPKSEVYAYRNTILFWAALVYILLLSLVYIFLSALLERIVVRGIEKTNTTLEKITEGNLNEKVNVRSNLEFISLSDGINTMVDALKQAIAEAASRLDNELDFAREIQRAALPRVFPPYPHKNEFDIFASMTAAKEIGGDFYDFFLLGYKRNRVGIVIADVSGKGIPAALFMMSAKTLIKNFAETGMSPAEVFRHANKKLCESNEAGMFVTAFMGVLEIETGKFTYVNAGHNPPFIKKGNGGFEQMKLKPGFVLGAFDSFAYEQEETYLNGDDTVFLYTDGVTEAQNNKSQLFGTDRLSDVLNKNTDKASKELLSAVRDSVSAYVDGAEQSDDLTMLALSYHPKEIAVPADIKHLDGVMDFVNDLLKKNSAPAKVVAQTDIVLDEVFTNICRYAYAPSDGGTVTVRCCVGGQPAFLSLVFRDKGKPFNPLNKPDPDITAKIEDREIGNLGIYMVKQIMDSVEYEYANGENILTVKKRF